MTIELKPFKSTGGLVLFLHEGGQPQDILSLRVPREALSLLALECINEIGMDASEELIAKCREVVKATDPVRPEDYVPPYRSDVFTDDEVNTMVTLQMEEIRDCLKDYAHEELEGCELIDCIGIIDPDSEETCRMLQLIGMDPGWAEMARLNDEDNEYGRVLDFCKRFKLITEDETNITDEGAKYVASFGDF